MEKMKKTLLVLMALLTTSVALAYDFSALAPSGQRLYYTIIGSSVQVNRQNTTPPYYSNYPTGNLTIPSSVSYNGTTYPVTSIGSYAFYYCSGLTSVTIPNSVDSICERAFGYCTSLKRVNLSESLTTIGDYAFFACDSITRLTIPNSVTTIGAYAFGSGCLRCVTIGESVTTIGYRAFYGCSHVDTMYYNAINLTTTPDWYNYNNTCNSYGFRPMISLRVLVIGDNVQTIPAGAFYNRTNLAKVNIPHGVTSIGEYAFYGCLNVDTLFYNASNLTTTADWYDDNAYGFRPMTYLHTLVIGDSVRSIPDRAFCFHDHLTSINISNSVTTIGDRAFAICTAFTGVTIPGSVTTIGDRAFWGCYDLNSIVIPASVTTIGYEAFLYCTDLRNVTISSSVTDIGNNAFTDCWNLTRVNYTGSIDEWCAISFGNQYSNPTYQTHSLEIGGEPVTTANISTATQISPYAFYRCYDLTNVTIPNTVTSIGNQAFHGCRGLTSITIPSSVTTIGDFAFDSCCSISSIRSESSVAPQLETTPFYGVDPQIPVYIPCGSLASYSSGWSCFSNFLETSDFIFSAYSADDSQGSVTVQTQPTCTGDGVVYAEPAEGFLFSHWSNGCTDNPYSFTLTQDTMLVAYFESVPVCVGEVEICSRPISTRDGQIVIGNVADTRVRIFDNLGRLLSTSMRAEHTQMFNIPVSGTYLVQIGNEPARKVVVVK